MMSRPHYVHSRRDEPEIDSGWLAVGVIVGAVGIKGAVRLKSFSDDVQAIFDRGPVTLFPDQHSQGQQRDVRLLHRIKAGYACQLSGVKTRDEAEEMKGVKLYVARENLPEIDQEDCYYYEDMTGLVARDTDGSPFGVVTAIYNFGAGDLLEVGLDDIGKNSPSGSKIYPFRGEYVPEVNIKQGFVVIDRAAFGDDEEPV